jgi:hypothetical protein
VDDTSWTFNVVVDSSLALTAFVALHCVLALMNNQEAILFYDWSLVISQQHSKQIS